MLTLLNLAPGRRIITRVTVYSPHMATVEALSEHEGTTYQPQAVEYPYLSKKSGQWFLRSDKARKYGHPLDRNTAEELAHLLEIRK